MSINDQEIARRFRAALNEIGIIPAGYARLGRGDTSGVILANLAQRRCYYFDGPTSQPTVTAKLAQDISISAINNSALEGTRVRLGYPPYDPKVLYIVGFDTGEGLDSVGGATPQEQLENKGLYPDVGSIQNLRIIAQETPDTTVFVNPTPYYDDTGAWSIFGGDTTDLSTEITALSSGEHQMAVICLDITTGDLVNVTSTAETGGVDDKDVFDWTTIYDLALSTDYIPAGAVHLYEGQTEIVEADIYRSSDPRAIFGKPMSSSGSGTVTSVSATATPTGVFDISVTNPTTTPAIALSMDNQAANTVLAGDPVSGSTTPAFRALVAADLPTVPISKGGTGQTAQTAAFDALSPTTTKGDIIADDGTDAVRLAVGSDGKVLTAKSSEATGLSWETPTTPAPVGATYIVQTADATLTNEQAMGALATGIVKNTTTTGVQSIAAPGTDYLSPTGTENFSNKTSTNKLMIDGSADETQLLVQGNATQTTLLAVFENSAGADQVTIAGNGAAVFNEAGNDADFRVEGDTNQNLIFVDASEDAVRIGGNNVQADSIFSIYSTTKGFRPPRLTTTERNAISSPNDGLIIFNTSTGKLDIYYGGVWDEVVMDSATATLSNKTLTSPTINTPTINTPAIEGATVFNDTGAAVTFRMESDTDPNNFLSDGTNNIIGIGTGTPDASAKLHVVSTTKGAISRPTQTAAQTAAISSPLEGLRAYNTDTQHDVVYDSQRYRSLGAAGWCPFALQLGAAVVGPTLGVTHTMTANGGSIAIPVSVPSHMLLQAVTLRNLDVSTARTWGWDLYEQYLNNGNSGENTLTRIASSNGNDTFTAAAASNRTLAATSAPVYIPPGIYWLVIQNRHATSSFALASTAQSSSLWGNTAQTKTTTNPNGATLDFVAATWTKVTAIYGVIMEGRVFGQTASF